MEARRSSPRARLMAVLVAAVGMAFIGARPAGHAGLGGVGQLPSCHSRSDCGPAVIGGLQITFTGWSCTAGFMTRAESRKLYLLTAGHCIEGSGSLALWKHHGLDIGRASVEAFPPGSNADVGAIEVTTSDATNEIYGSGNADIRSVNGWAPDSSQTVGSEVCRSGGTSGWRCGAIVTADVDTTIAGRLIHHTWWTDFPSARGDSGAPVLDHDGRAAGILIATTPTQSVYSTVDGIGSALHARLCVSAACD
jgi:hypothetical protein